MILINNFPGLSCPYYAVGAPLTAVRYGVRAVATDHGERIAEGYGVMDRLSYRWNGMLLSEVTADANGQDFVGRTGFPLSGTGGGTASYGWNGAGLLNSDTSRGITRTTYNHLSLPTTVTFSDKSHVDYTYNAAGELQTVTTYAMVAGAKRPVKVGQRSYCGDFVFEGDSLTEVNFAGGYFDGEGRPHFRHADWQGNVAIVTDRDGQIEQHNGYYPYGEPWREPTGQNRLFGGKERMRDGGLNDYDYVARRLNSATGIWAQPDPMARDFAGTNPYVFCGANPIKFIDPSGKTLQLLEDRESAINELKRGLNGIKLKMDKDGNISFTYNKKKLTYNDVSLVAVINDPKVHVKITAQTQDELPENSAAYVVGGSYMGNTYNAETGEVTTDQRIRVPDLEAMSDFFNEPGQAIIHEITESYKGGQLAIENKESSPPAGIQNSTYQDAHNLAVPQILNPSGRILEIKDGAHPSPSNDNSNYINYFLYNETLMQKLKTIKIK